MDHANQQDSSTGYRRERGRRLSVHFTHRAASLIAPAEAVREDWTAMFAWLGIALVSMRGWPIGAAGCHARATDWSGEVAGPCGRLFYYVFVPAYAIRERLLLPLAAPLLGGHRRVRAALFRRSDENPTIISAGSAYGSPRRSIYSASSPALSSSQSPLICEFVPFNVVHPVRVRGLRALTLSLIGVWARLRYSHWQTIFDVARPSRWALCGRRYVVGSDAAIRLARFQLMIEL